MGRNALERSARPAQSATSVRSMTQNAMEAGSSMNTRLNGISFAELPHISKNEEVTIIRETGELWDSDARPAYSVRLEGLHIGYIPLVETIKEEALMARDGFKKVWKTEFQSMTPDELREVARKLNENGELMKMGEFTFVGKDKMRQVAKNKMLEAENAEIIRDWLFTEIMRNHLIPRGKVAPVYFDKDHGRNLDEIGDICSLSVMIDIW